MEINDEQNRLTAFVICLMSDLLRNQGISVGLVLAQNVKNMSFLTRNITIDLYDS